MVHNSAQSLKGKAMADLDAGRLPQALKKALLGTKKFPNDSDYHAIAGFVLVKLERHKAAIPHFIEASRTKPNDPQFVENVANSLMKTGQTAQALAYAEQKLEVFPENKELQRVIDEIVLKASHWRDVIVHMTRRLNTDPDNTTSLLARSRAYAHLCFTEESLQDLNRAYAIDPDNEKIAFLKAVNLHQAGQKADCADILWGILATHPGHKPSLLKLSSILNKDQVSELIAKVENAMQQSSDSVAELEFAKAYLVSLRDGLPAAMPQFARANKIKSKAAPYDMAKQHQTFRRTCALFPIGAPSVCSGLVAQPVPIFVVGQPRSGTTLMEMMLSNLPQVAGFGEMSLGAELSRLFTEGNEVFDAAAAREFARSFREWMPPVPEGSKAFVDKLPNNYQRLGFLLAAFPNARIINMLRDPRDVGLSKWVRFFPASGMRYASDFEMIAQVANLYRRYISHWEQIFGDRILTVRYEDLVADPDLHSQKVADFCGLEWSERMIHPEENTKQVLTASIEQVRQPISTRSVGGWARVADQIGPMLDGFDHALWPEYDFS